jgi:hypothetical protein
MDCFTKWPEAYAIPNQESSTVVEVLVTNLFCCFGVPRELRVHSDQGHNFKSHLMTGGFATCGSEKDGHHTPALVNQTATSKRSRSIYEKSLHHTRGIGMQDYPQLLITQQILWTIYMTSRMMPANTCSRPVTGWKLAVTDWPSVRATMRVTGWLYHSTHTNGKSPKLQSIWEVPYKVITQINDAYTGSNGTLDWGWQWCT